MTCDVIEPEAATTFKKQYLWKKADFAAMSGYILNFDWYGIFTVTFTPDDLWSAFTAVLNDAIDKFDPFTWVRSDNLFRRSVR